MSADGDIVRAPLYVYWCPRCQCQSERAWHFCKKGPPLIPQFDEETHCERIEVAALARLYAAEAQRDALAEALRMQGWDIGEAQLCWCPHGWWDREQDTGAEQTEHSTGCRMARAAMGALS